MTDASQDNFLSPERCAAIRARLEGLAEILSTRMTVERNADDSAAPYYRVSVPTRELDAAVNALREGATALAAYEQITRERDKGERVFQAVVYAFEGKEVPDDLLTHGMVRRAMKHREAAEAALVVLTQRQKAVGERLRKQASFGLPPRSSWLEELAEALAGEDK